MNPRDRRNAILNLAGESLWGLQAAMIASGTVLTILLRDYGAGQQMIGSVVTLETVLSIAPQVAGIYLFRSRRHRKVQLLVWHLMVIIPWLFAMAAVLHYAPGLSRPAVRWLLYGCWGGFMLFTGVCLSAWMDWLAGLFHVSIRGTVLGLSFAASALAGFAGALVSGRLLGSHPGVGTYSVLYALSGVLAVASIGAFFAVDDRGAKHEPDHATGTRELLGHFGESLRDSQFRSFLAGRILSAAGFCIRPFIAIYYMTQAGGALSEGLVVTLSAGGAVGGALANALLGRLGDRHGHRLGLLIGVATQAAALVLLLATHGAWSCCLVFALSGISGSAGFISHYNMMFETCPHGHRLAHITVGNLVYCAGTALVPLLGGALADAAGLRPLFGASLAVSVVAFAWMLLLVKEPRKAV